MNGAASGELRARIEGSIGRITLCRAGKLNALSHAMVLEMRAALEAWRDDERVSLVLLEGEGGRAFCAGGDIAAIQRQGAAGDIDGYRRFFRDEYRLNALIAAYSKPIVAVMDGITMGGGIGLSAHASHRIVTERSVLAMPECTIGLVPDVGATHLLARAPGHAGEYLALSGARMDAADALHAGLADRFVPHERLEALVTALVAGAGPEAIDDAEPSCGAPPGASTLAGRAPAIDALFGQARFGDVLAALELDERAWVGEARERIAAASPLALHLAFDLIGAARREPGVMAALIREYRFSSRAVEQGDLLEGVRAVLIDKDGAPRWRQASVGQVDAALIETMKRPAPGGDLRFD